jgi:SAM-dependent methyltransferase
MSLAEFAIKTGSCLSVNEMGTDKEYNHLYLSRVYEPLFQQITPVKRLLEIGLGGGFSIRLWMDYLDLDSLIAIESNPEAFENALEKDIKKVQLIHADAYSRRTVKSLPSGFDIVVDDGPHAFWSLKAVIRMYVPKLRLGGVLVIEDIPNIEGSLSKLLMSANWSSICCAWLIDSRLEARLKEDSVALILHRKSGLCDLNFQKGIRVFSPSFPQSVFFKILLFLEVCLEFFNRKLYHGIKFRFTKLRSFYTNTANS